MPYKDRGKRPLRGLCIFCAQPTIPLRAKCKHHLEKDRKYARIKSKIIKEERKLKGLCVYCNYKLDEIADKGRVSCINCRER